MRIADAGGAPALYFADGAATIYALNAESGKVIWKVHPWNFAGAMATGTLQVYKGKSFTSRCRRWKKLWRADPEVRVLQVPGECHCSERSHGREALADVHDSGGAETDAQELYGNAAIRTLGCGRMVNADP